MFRSAVAYLLVCLSRQQFRLNPHLCSALAVAGLCFQSSTTLGSTWPHEMVTRQFPESSENCPGKKETENTSPPSLCSVIPFMLDYM